MNSLCATLYGSSHWERWQILRLPGDEVNALSELFRALTTQGKELTPPQFPGTKLLYDAAVGAAMFIESESVAPALLGVQGDRFTVGLCRNVNALADLDKLLKLGANFQKGNGASLSAAMNNALKSFENSCRNRVLEAVQSDPRLDREGADFFDTLEFRLRALFRPDYIEIAPLSPSTYWMDRPDGWSWIYASRNDFQWPVTLSTGTEEDVMRGGAVKFISLSSVRDGLEFIPARDGNALTCGLLIPLLFRGKRLGLVKLFFARSVIPAQAETTSLALLQNGISLIFDRTAEYLRTQRMAMVDGLTNLFNHRFFLTQLRTEYQRSVRYGGVMTLLMIDVDGFKNYNDTYGHLAGNRVLAWVAAQIRRNVRDIDVVARYGGEEFALILPEVRAEQGLAIAEKIRKAISTTDITTDEGDHLAPITISCGVTDSQGCKGPEEMIDRADRALYWVKRNGRNLVRLAAVEG